MFQSERVANLSSHSARLAVRVRSFYYRLLEPIDALCRRLNSKTELPPIWLRRYVGPLESFESAAAEFAGFLKLLGGLQPSSRVLDLGCGCGALALQLRRYIKPEQGGGYIGLDIHRPSIEWCRRHFPASGFQFAVLDAFNATYRPDGQRHFDYAAALSTYGLVDVVVAKSLFTHLRPEDVQAYLEAVAVVLKPEGRLLFTAFLFDEHDDLNTTEVKFPFGDAQFRHAYQHRVESATAFAESFMREMLGAAGLEIIQFYKGGWRTAQAGLTFQDLVVARRRSATT